MFQFSKFAPSKIVLHLYHLVFLLFLSMQQNGYRPIIWAQRFRAPPVLLDAKGAVGVLQPYEGLGNGTTIYPA